MFDDKIKKAARSVVGKVGKQIQDHTDRGDRIQQNLDTNIDKNYFSSEQEPIFRDGNLEFIKMRDNDPEKILKAAQEIAANKQFQNLEKSYQQAYNHNARYKAELTQKYKGQAQALYAHEPRVHRLLDENSIKLTEADEASFNALLQKEQAAEASLYKKYEKLAKKYDLTNNQAAFVWHLLSATKPQTPLGQSTDPKAQFLGQIAQAITEDAVYKLYQQNYLQRVEMNVVFHGSLTDRYKAEPKAENTQNANVRRLTDGRLVELTRFDAGSWSLFQTSESMVYKKYEELVSKYNLTPEQNGQVWGMVLAAMPSEAEATAEKNKKQALEQQKSSVPPKPESGRHYKK